MAISVEREREIIRALEDFDTPSITNVLATYPAREDICMGLYHPWEGHWYTDQTLRAMYPELGRRCGYAVTCVVGMPDPNFKRLGWKDVFQAVAAAPGPVVMVMKQNFPEEIKKINGLVGGNMASAFKSLGVTAIMSDGPSRDIDELRPMGLQYMLTGATAGHGPFTIQAVNVPVEICGMHVCPGEMIHLDESGAVKFPRDKLEEVLERVTRLREEEEEKQRMLRSTSDPELLAKYMAGLYK